MSSQLAARLLFVLGLYAVRCLDLVSGSLSPRATIVMLATCAAGPSLGLSGLLMKRPGGADKL